jgi:ATP-binding cassette subfamily B protein
MIRLYDVSKVYGEIPALREVTLHVAKGEFIYVTGASGAGKTTFLKMVYGATKPTSGKLLVSGIDVAQIPASRLHLLRRNIGVVFQEVLLFNRSIAENLRVGKPDATDAEIREAAARAQALDFIGAKPEGFEATAGERGRMLSGGERQRVSIARALLKNPPILILDEATSALDAATEARVQAALDEVMKDRTTFVIAHRLSTVRNATRILVFEHARIVESGTFDELVRQNGVFAGLARAQYLATEATTPPAIASDAAE